ncbi:MAG: cardiolipin synthase [Paraprevotella sp.]|nr:cardiolipin synthase [Paraprevotella sp.]
MFDVVIYSIIGAFYLFVVLSQMLVVILENHQPVKTVAWLMVLFFLPVAGLVAYFFFGRNRKREHFVSKACASQLARRAAVRFYQGGFPEVPEEHKPLIKLFRRQSGALPYANNKIRFFTAGVDMLDNLLRDIASARHHIHVEFYIIEDDRVGRTVCEALAAKVREGVSVRLVYDDVGCWNVKKIFFRQMEEKGMQVAPFLPVRFPKLTSKVDFRNHRKIVVIDGIIGYVGGMNLAERYFYPAESGEPAWRDTHTRLMGNAVAGLQRAFLSDWYVAVRQTITEQVYFPHEDECRKIMDSDREAYASLDALIQIVTSIPTAPWPDIMQGLVLAVMRARKYCYLQSPYFMPTERMLFALQTAALAGVDVRLMIPERTDKRFLTWASRSFLYDVIRAGVRVYLYYTGFLHSKTLVCDDTLASCGSTNIDFRSFERNFEVNAFVYDRGAALSLKEIFLKDQTHCRLLNLETWETRSIWYRMAESSIRLLSPLL